MQTNRLTFIVPGLLDPVPYLDQLPTHELPELPIFSTMLSRGRLSIPELPDFGYHNYYSCLLNEFAFQGCSPGDETNSSKQLPIASICYCFDAENAPESALENKNVNVKGKWLLRVDPCFMAPDRDQLVLAEVSNLDISMAEARQLVAEINEFFQSIDEESFWTLHAITPQRWYLVSDKVIDLQTIPPENVLGQSVKSFLVSGTDSGHWLNLFNEFQMILHHCPVNKQRVEQGKLPINSLWFWGAGREIDCSGLTGDSKQTTNTIVYADDLFAKALAKLNNHTHLDVADRYQPFSSKGDHQTIYIISTFIQALQNKDIFSWVGLLKQFENLYLEPLAKDIKAGKIARVEFVSPTGRRLLLNKKLLNRWWRKKMPFYKFLSTGS